MSTIKKIYLLLFLCTPFFAFAQNEKIPFDAKIKYGQLPNGLKYFILQNKKPEKKIELRMVLNAGSILEDKDQLGLAHMMEHMNFNGLKNFPKNEVVHYLQSIGVKFGADLNAYTGFDETVYILPIPSDDKSKIDSGFQIIADWSGAALLQDDEIDKERGVVLEESRLGKGADDRMMKKWLPEYLNGSRYAERLPIGDDDLLKTFKYDVIKRFHKDWYRPDLEAVIVVGDIDPVEAEKIIKAKFSGFKNPVKERPRPAFFEIPERTSSKAMVLSDNEAAYTSIQIIGNSKKKQKATTVNEYIEEVKQDLFNSMMGARLNELKNTANPPFIYGFGGFSGGWARGYESFQLFSICGTNKIKEATEALIKEALKAKKFGFTQAEFERAKANTLASYEQQFNEKDKTESNVRVEELIRHFLENESAPGIEWEYKLVKKALPNIKLEDVNNIRNNITIDKSYFALVTTKTADKLPSDADMKNYIDASLKAELVAYKEKVLPKSLLEKSPVAGKVISEAKDEKLGTTIWILSNGAKVTFKKTDFKNDEILISGYRFGGSSVYEGKDYQSADFANNVVNEMGYGQFSNTDLQKFLSGKSISVNTYLNLNQDVINGKSSVKDLETAMQLLYLKSSSPRRDEMAFESFKNRQVQLLAQIKSDPQNYFDDSLNKYKYNNHPRNKYIPEESDFNLINLDNAISFYNSRFNTAKNMNYFFVGSIPDATFKTMVEKYIGGLSAGDVISTTKDLDMKPISGDNKLTIKMGNEPKSMVNEMSYFYTPYSQKDELALSVLTEILNNRITDIIREKMSAIYGGGVSVRLAKFPKEEFSMESDLPCGPENAEKVKAAFWDILNDCKKPSNINSEELKKATETLLQKYKVGVKTNGYWASLLSKYQQFVLPSENALNYESRLKAFTIDNLTEVANKYFSSTNVLHGLLMPDMK